MNPNSHIPYLQAQLAFAWHNRLVLDRRLSADSWYSRCSQPTLHRRYEYAQILIHLSLGQQSYRTNFEDEVTTYNQYPQRPRKPGHKEETTCFATSPNQNHQAH